MVNGIDDYIFAWQQKKCVRSAVLQHWENKIKVIDDIVTILRSRKDDYSKNISLKNHYVKHLLKQIHDHSVVTLNDSVAFICQWFYLEVLLKVVGISRIGPKNFTKTYEGRSSINQEVINKHSQHIRNNFNLSCDEDNKSFPSSDWLCKLHKK